MLCSISGAVPEEPVVSKVSGHLFEKRLVIKIIQETGRDPVTDEPLTEDDLLPLKVGKATNPRTLAATSIPGLLSLFQNEWDAAALELHELRTALHKTRQELSHALYQHDAATRVIARLLTERDALRAAAEAGSAAAPANGKREPAAAAEEEDAAAAKRPRGGVSGEVVEALTAASAALSKARKKRVVPESVATPEEVAALHAAGSFPLHKTRKGGIEALALAPDAPGLVASAGGDGSVQLYDVAATRSVAELLGHTKRVTGVAFAGSSRVVLSASADHTVRVWRAGDEGYAQAAAVDAGAEVVAVAAHPTCPYAVSAAADGSWAFDDVEAGARLATVRDEEAAAYSTAALHPDGLILVTGTTEGAVRVWETRTQKRVAAFGEHSGAIAGVSFSENGYHMATAAADGVRLWDLRKLKNFATLTPFGENVPATCVSFDHSGLYLAVGGPDVKIFGAKQDWAELGSLSLLALDNVQGTHAVRFGPDAKSLLVGASDHNLRYFTL